MDALAVRRARAMGDEASPGTRPTIRFDPSIVVAAPWGPAPVPSVVVVGKSEAGKQGGAASVRLENQGRNDWCCTTASVEGRNVVDDDSTTTTDSSSPLLQR